MPISMSKRKPGQSRKPEKVERCSCYTFFCKFISRVPTAAFALMLIFLWSSSTTFFTGNIVHVCVSSRKLSHLYCVSAGTHPNLELPVSKPNFTIDSFQTIRSINRSQSYQEIGVNINDIAHVTSSTTIGQNMSANIQQVIDAFKEDGRSSGTSILSNEVGELQKANQAAEILMHLHRTWAARDIQDGCKRGGIYVYDLPSKFNKDLVSQCDGVMPWMDFCKYFRNEALGEPIPELGNGWYNTHQYALEPIFHNKMLKHPCRVYDEAQARIFYVPYYGGLDILRWHFKNVSDDVKDSLGLELVKLLTSRKTWMKNSGKDHVFVLGKISWDFRRSSDSSWGTRFLLLEQMQNPVRLLIERQPWEINDFGIPHPTYFHPHSDTDITEWQTKILQTQRKYIVSFAGAARPDQPKSIRTSLIHQCKSTNESVCKFFDCRLNRCEKPETIIQMFMESEFCLQPPGDSPTRKSVFDSLVSGCIPVFFDPYTAYYQYPWHLPEDHSKYSVFINQEEVRLRNTSVIERLLNISAIERETKRKYIVYELLPGLVYGDASSHFEKFQDAFTITVNNLLERALKL